MNMMSGLNGEFAKQTEEFFRAATSVGMPESLKALAEDSVAKSRETCEKFAAAARDASNAFSKVGETTSEGIREIGEKALANFSKNTTAAFDAAEAVMRAKSLPEAAQLQVDFVRSQLAKSNEQAREMLELSARIGRQAFETFASAASAFNPVRYRD